MIVFADSLREVIVLLVEFESLEEKTAVVLGENDEDEMFLQQEFRKNTHILHPEGLGERIRGLRAKNVIFIKSSKMDPEVVNHIILGFAAVSSNPIKELKRKDKQC